MHKKQSVTDQPTDGMTDRTTDTVTNRSRARDKKIQLIGSKAWQGSFVVWINSIGFLRGLAR